MATHAKGWRKCERGFTDEEKVWLSKLLSVEFAGRSELLEQVQNARVSGVCDCGCRTVDIDVRGSCRICGSSVRVPVEMTATMSDGMPVVFLLHVLNGRLSELEVFRADSSPIRGPIDTRNAVITVNLE